MSHSTSLCKSYQEILLKVLRKSLSLILTAFEFHADNVMTKVHKLSYVDLELEFGKHLGTFTE